MIRKLTIKQKKFADEYIKTGNATQSYFDAGYSMKSKNGAGVEGNKLLNNPKIKDYISKRLKKIEDAKIPKQKEILEFLGGVMRGTLTSTVVTKMGEIEVPPDWKERVAAAKELLKRMPVNDPIAEAKLRKLNAEATLAESRTNESQDKSGRMRKLISKMSDKDIKHMIEKLEDGDN